MGDWMRVGGWERGGLITPAVLLEASMIRGQKKVKSYMKRENDDHGQAPRGI